MPAQAILSGPDSEAVNPLPQASFRRQRTRPPFEGIRDILPLFSKHTLATSRKYQGQPSLRHPITALPFAYKNKSLLFHSEIGDLLLSLFSGVVPPEKSIRFFYDLPVSAFIRSDTLEYSFCLHLGNMLFHSFRGYAYPLGKGSCT